jgi:hypothetical protein
VRAIRIIANSVGPVHLPTRYRACRSRVHPHATTRQNNFVVPWLWRCSCCPLARPLSEARCRHESL